MVRYNKTRQHIYGMDSPSPCLSPIDAEQASHYVRDPCTQSHAHQINWHPDPLAERDHHQQWAGDHHQTVSPWSCLPKLPADILTHLLIEAETITSWSPDHPAGAVFQNCLPETISLTWESETNITPALNKPALLNKATKSPKLLPKEQWPHPPADLLVHGACPTLPRKRTPAPAKYRIFCPKGVEICWQKHTISNTRYDVHHWKIDQ